MSSKKQISDSIICGLILAISGGAMDAYSYLLRGEVFANAQTGNMLLLGVNLAEGKIETALLYLWPVLAFAFGIVLSDLIRARFPKSKPIHWRQLAVLMELIFLVVVAFIPLNLNTLANVLISFVCGIQVESFRSIRGNTVATTMCIGNLRSATHNLNSYIRTKDKEKLMKAFLYFGIILSFVLGAIIESSLIKSIGEKAIFLSVVMLLIATLMMFIHKSDHSEDLESYIGD